MTLLHDSHDLWPKFFDAAFGGEVELSRGLRFNQTTLTIDAALAGQGIALASRFLVQRDLEAGHLVQPLDNTLEGGLDFYLLTPRQGASDASLHVRDWLLGMSNQGT
ncbi:MULTISPECIES: LysR substrate-binding domain-containing protein [unclassified Roseivivax]|uniref:LysR substrate-binding domain-containing protein n=1 Tax=unclassified Roseivivax TaxID=2639302 RepID=UPI0020C76453|nr:MULTISPECIES: LysR substrate-binding domain-containing protein [unclassified Roseivivax]